MKANFGILPALENSDRLHKRDRARAHAARSLADLEIYLTHEN
jgi:folate-dependent tRNA-U54 methylase TrmFO/GidA